jgi:uncharacterized delta-60 repeat protein
MATDRDLRRVVTFTLVNLLIASRIVHGGADLDSSFGSAGKVTTDVTGRYEEVRALVIEPDGQIVAAGVAGTGVDQDFALARYNLDGSLDRTFGTGGVVITDFSGGSDAAWALVLQPDGKLVAAGVASGDFGLVRYNADGSLDVGFGIGGKITTDFGRDDRVNALAVQQDGKIVAAGVADSLDFALARYHADGTPDQAFGSGGSVVTDFSGKRDSVFAVTTQSDGMIVAAGFTGTFPTAEFVVARYHVDGSLDENFGDAGSVAISFGKDARAHALAIQPDGKIVTGGFVNRGSSTDAAVTRHNPDGTMDTSFGDGGKIQTDFGGRNFGSAMVIQPDGRIVVAGADDFPPYYDFALALYGGDGTRDMSFADGTLLTEFGGNSWISAVAVQSDGKIIAAGYARTSSGGDFALARYVVSR